MEKIIFEYNDFDGNYALESAWAEKSGDNYKLDNILFYAPGYSWGDIVKVENRDGELFVIELVEESGHSTVRVIFYSEELIDPTIKQLEIMGCHWEGSNLKTLFSIDISPEVNYAPIREFLEKGEENDLWSFEESCLAHNI